MNEKEVKTEAETPVTNIDTNAQLEANPKSKWKKGLKWLIVIGLVGGVGYAFYAKNQVGVPNTKGDKETGRIIDYVDKERLDASIADAEFQWGPSELEKPAYNETVQIGANVQITIDGAGGGSTVELDKIYKGGNIELWYAGVSCRNPEDELINPNENGDFNDFTSAAIAMDNQENKKLNDEELNVYAEKAATLADDLDSPAKFYIKDLILTLKGKTPTLASVNYLMFSNRILPSQIVDENYEYNDYLQYFDKSFTSESEEKSLINVYTTSIERPNNDKLLGLTHNQVDGLLTTYGVADWFSTMDYPGTNTRKGDESTIINLYHYKDISNKMIAEYAIGSGNLDAYTMGIKTGLYSQYKPSFTWGISPLMEDICSAYYDIVEPQVYKGTFTNRTEAYNKVSKKLNVSTEDVKRAVMTYEYWALSK